MAFIMLVALGSTVAARAQSGELRGKVTNQESGEPITRATVVIADTKLGAITDLNGVYTIRRVPPGRYKVRATFVGYRTVEVSDVAIADGVARLDMSMEAVSLRQSEIVVTAKAGAGTETAILNERRKSANVTDGISAAQMRRLPDATGADALSRVTGLSITGSRFVNVRGTNERYSNTQLNGVSMISTEPDRKSFSYDMVPSNLLENTIVSKTFTPDQPGDFAGGLVQLNTIDFPDQATFRLSLGSAYVSGTTFSSLSMGPRGSEDFLGVDDGLRQFPSGVPDTGAISTTNYTPEQRAAFAKLFPNNYVISPVHAGPNMNLVASFGDRLDVLDNDLGIVAAFSYRNGFEKTNLVRNDTTTAQARFDYQGQQNSYTTLWGGMLNLSYKIGDLHTISVRNLYNRTAEDQLTMVHGINYSSFSELKIYTFDYLEREFYSGQVAGDHLFPALGGMRFTWRGYGSLGSRNQPDLRRLSYARDASDTTFPFIAGLATQGPNIYSAGRYYADLNEELFGGSGDVMLPVAGFKIKAGALTENKTRDFSQRSIGYTLDAKSAGLRMADIDTLFDASHISEKGISIEETTQPSDKYDAHSHLNAGYMMVDVPFAIADQKFRTIVGARMEDWHVLVHSFGENAPLTVDYRTKDWLPSLNLTYEVLPTANIRLAYSRTVARPEFREFAGATFYDFILDALTFGNPDLHRTLIDNYDFRFEVFPDAGELLAVSVFHKKFTDAIEAVTLRGHIFERTWANANGENTGVEFEVRKSLGFVAEWLGPLSISVNYTWLDSKIEVDSSHFSAGTARRLQGQSPYIINAGLYYDNADLGTSITLAYNRYGERINTVGRELDPDLIEQPRDRVDFTISQALQNNFELKLSVKDILAQDLVSTQLGRPVHIDSMSSSVSLGLTMKF